MIVFYLRIAFYWIPLCYRIDKIILLLTLYQLILLVLTCAHSENNITIEVAYDQTATSAARCPQIKASASIAMMCGRDSLVPGGWWQHTHARATSLPNSYCRFRYACASEDATRAAHHPVKTQRTSAKHANVSIVPPACSDEKKFISFPFSSLFFLHEAIAPSTSRKGEESSDS